jgi:hypothetical protein
MNKMQKREKVLAAVIVAFLVLLVGGFGLKAFLLAPLKKIDKETSVLRDKLAKLNNERKEYFANEDFLRSTAQKTFGLQIDQASARSGEILTSQILAAGLNEADFTRLPVGPRKLRGASEIGWSVAGRGNLPQMLNLLYMLENLPYLHRIENFVITPDDRPGKVRARFHFLTLVADAPPDLKWKELPLTNSLKNADRQLFALISDRDILRPYIKRTAPPQAPANPPATAPSKGPGPENFKLVSLSQWEGEPEALVLDIAAKKTTAYKPGDELAGGKLVAIDYRPLPLARFPELLSESRIILQIGAEYWAVERGQTLAEKRKLDSSLWPAPEGSNAK